ncbi:acyl-CoA reductase-like NAD-dependent aldehyde dehydrogenase [Streptomyces sp. Amel2xB2]|uniref:aldehyde dehydrogenase family protein n=1 Tax=Streptomyces sp. Amel2xB2 TaxID=1305829 RepID=UPI000DB9E324|nr:aldehyde dehydrogenase family protein [Streptomyces sp. Amel2xB2]RAJ69040.1 acyl-CoA reductase-like NAD-dependent aldehyde dehydrogenase [Streptomyces sp. Amel2xB2]
MTGTGRFASLSPATGQQLAEYPVHGPEEIADAVGGAREAAKGWARAGWKGRKAALLTFKRALAARMGEVAETVTAETGKPDHDARTEVLLAVIHLDWAARHARRVLGRRRVPSGLLSTHQRSLLAYRPLGVIGVIGPWNYPVYTPMGSIGYALAAGNGVVFKPSELTPGVGVLLARIWAETVPEHAGLFSAVTGEGRTGDALARSGVDKVAFTGSPGTARKVAAACAESLTPLTAEGGGKDAVLVGGDLDGPGLDRAAEAIVWGAVSNAGQTCTGVERVYAVESVHEDLCRRVVRRAAQVSAGPQQSGHGQPDADGTDADGSGRAADYGPMTLPSQLDTVERHLKDAVAAGARVLHGGPESVSAPYVQPVVLADVPEDAAVMREETFGPLVAVNSVRDLEEAVERADASPYALGAAVFTGSFRAGRAAAEQLRAGMVSVGSVLGYAAVPSLPFGGSGESGYGRVHGEEGLRGFAAPQAITVRRFSPPVDLTSYATPRAKAARTVELARRFHARM